MNLTDTTCRYCGKEVVGDQEIIDTTALGDKQCSYRVAHPKCHYDTTKKRLEFAYSLSECRHKIEAGQTWLVKKSPEISKEVRIVSKHDNKVSFECDGHKCNPMLEPIFRNYATFVR